jgi:lipopolysaccharide export system permease protein
LATEPKIDNNSVRLLDRYVIRNFCRAYLYCIVGFLSIWLIFDISDNISIFLDRQFTLLHSAQFYLTQLPQVLIIMLPVSLLLALLFSLGRMSRTNELISMLTAGVSLLRLLAPLFAVSLLTTLLSLALNYSAAPHAELARTNYLSPNSRGVSVQGQIFRNRTDARTWYIQNFLPHDNTFNNVQVLQQDENDNIVTTYVANRALYRPDTKWWQLDSVKVINYDNAGNILRNEIFPSITITNWSETPFRLGSADVRAEFLSLPELHEYIQANADFPITLLAPFATHFQYRLALPWHAFVIALMGAPLGIGFSRRGVFSSVAIAIVLIFSMNFINHLFLALGEGYRISPWLAAWAPNIIFAILGLYLFYTRAANRDAWNFSVRAPRRIVS